MTLVFFGTSAFGIPSLEAIKRSGHTLSLVVTTPSKPSGRGLKLTGSPIKEWAIAHAYPVVEWDRENLSQLMDTIRQLKPDLFVVTSFGVLLKKEWLQIPRVAPVNLHASILPNYRGASPMQMAILNGDVETGVSVMRMVPKCDAGDVLLIEKMKLDEHETTPSLEAKLSRLAADSLIKALPVLGDGSAVWKPQDERSASTCTKIEKSQGRLDWKKPAVQLDREIRAYAGWPGSYFFYEGKRIHVGQAQVGKASASGSQAGKIIEASADKGVIVACGEGALVFTALQLEGRKMLPVADFLRGYSLKAGDFLE